MLEERGEKAAAEHLKTSALAEALHAVRTTSGEPAEEIDHRVEAIMAHEQERVANAAVLAELLVPLLRQPVDPAAGRASSPDVALSAVSGASVAPFAGDEAEGSGRSSAPRAAPANIADFIDEMLAQERGHVGGAAHRRAS